MVMRGGTSKGLYFLADDLPADAAARDDLLLRIMGSPDARQIDGLGGAHPLTSKVAVVSARSARDDADVDYLFLQVVRRPGDRHRPAELRQHPGRRRPVRRRARARGRGTRRPTASVRILMVNTDSLATATVPASRRPPRYGGDAAIDGVPGTAAAVTLDFADIAGGSCGALLPTGNAVDVIDGVEVT